MLKPKRKITKKEIQRDPFLEGIFSLKEHLNEKKQLYTRSIIGIIAVMLAVWLYTNNQSVNREAAENIISKAMVYIDLDDHENAMIHLREVIDEYGSTPAGRVASYYLGRIYFDKNEYEMALPHFERYANKGKNPLLFSSTYRALVEIYKVNNDLTNAIKYQKMATENANSKEERAWTSLGLAELSLANGNKQDAQNLVNGVLEEFENNFELKQKADEITGKIIGREQE
ncbi:MAG: tetratricopeptide repeat protein [Candidatus Marinimicrobia bacterium]|jgi:tetratricopeptide (TPR) repeat protein|nr:tetratricopeptide repeat protein [Candidatus Neomarinimicrobiota bacterium]MDP6611072.1 tetratricopeptide repeat protein [Candidatus Neomarinimicrobiota bacterium]|tara:strand:+ start:22539 stop:23225 length:687 start_codon:yes stop_codon:yes gene_type:complete